MTRRTAAVDSADVYLATIDRMEPELSYVDRDAALPSIAISLKRIADALDRLQRPAPAETGDDAT